MEGIKSVVIIIAMEAEAMPLITHLGLTQQSNYFGHAAPFHCFNGKYKGYKLAIVTNGKDRKFGCDNVGTVPAALATYLAVESLKPDLLINAGTAGGFESKGMTIGDVLISSTIHNHDRRMILPIFVDYGVHNHTAVETPRLREALKFKLGVVTTGNSLDHVEADDALMAANDASVKDMEAAAVAWAAELYAVPYFALKVVTDIVDGKHATEDEFVANFSMAQKQLQKSVPAALDFILGKRLADL
ncbi:Hypothetical protein NocV09_00202760 [Nannochloropsis oceanica]